MNKLVVTLVAGAAALVASGSVFAVDTHRSQTDPSQSQEPTQQEQVPVNSQGGPAEIAPPAAASDAPNINPEFAAALKKCDSMNGARKAACEDGARTKFGQM